MKECGWVECSWETKFTIDPEVPRVAVKKDRLDFCSVIGSPGFPPDEVSSLSIKALKLSGNNGVGCYIGVAPSEIGQDKNNYKQCGWYLYCYDSKLWSGAPHSLRGKEYGPRKKDGGYFHEGDSIGIVMDMARGDLSFVVNGVNLGVAYSGIPTDKPLVPCVILRSEGESVELDPAAVEDSTPDSAVPVPPNVTAESNACDSITLSWDAVEGASFYQVEVDGSRSWAAATANTLTRVGLPADTEHSFRVRCVAGRAVGEWSGAAKGRTQKAPEFSGCAWKACGAENGRYSAQKGDRRVAAMNGGYECCTIIGDTPFPPGSATSCNIRVLESVFDRGENIWVGVAPADIDLCVANFDRCGWYFYCYNSGLFAGPPHNYGFPGREYGPRKKDGEYIHKGGSVGVAMDTARGDLSFAVNSVNYGVAFEGIPLDKPLVPCVVLKYPRDCVEIDPSGVKERVRGDVPVPPNVNTTSVAWDAVTLSWDAVEGAAFYQVVAEERKPWCFAPSSKFTVSGLEPATKYTVRVRAVKEEVGVSAWSAAVEVVTQKKPDFSESAWKECPEYVTPDRRYSLNAKNPRITSKIEGKVCTVIGDTPLPAGTVTSWGIRIVKTKHCGSGISIGVAPFDIDQNECNREKCGWYFDCWEAKLFAGPPHNYKCLGESYGSCPGYGNCVRKGHIVGLVMDTKKGELSFVLKGKNAGTAFEGIPLDKPLVPCVILENEGNSVELLPNGSKGDKGGKDCVIS